MPDPTTKDTPLTLQDRIHAAILHADYTPDRATDAARHIHDRILDARNSRRYHEGRLLDYEADQINRAEIIHLLRCSRPWDGSETTQALTAIETIENELGVQFPTPNERQRFFPTSLSIWDKLKNTYACYGPDGCGAWVSGDGVKGLCPHWCPCGNRVVL